MRYVVFIAMFFCIACSNPYKGVSPQMAKHTREAISSVGARRGYELKQTLEFTDPTEREGLAFLIANMPKSDLCSLQTSILISNNKTAYKARNTYSWAKELPMDIFLNEVMPYAVVDESRTEWRQNMQERLHPLVKSARTIYQAIDTINYSLSKLLNVEYSSVAKENQSPEESVESGKATSLGLSILLIDAFRSVGIPSRLAGTQQWTNFDGSHYWVEVWIDRAWYFTEYNYGKLNHTWFLERAGRAEKGNPKSWIYANSFKPQPLHFPSTWHSQLPNNLYGIESTDRYIKTYRDQQYIKKDGIALNIKMYKTDACPRLSEDRVSTLVKVYDGMYEFLQEAETVAPQASMNDYLTFYMPENGTYILEWHNGTETKRQTIELEGTTTVELFYN